MKSILALTVIFSSSLSLAAIPTPTAKAQQKMIMTSGARAGGVAGTGFALLDVHSKINREGTIERLMFDVGDLEGRPQKGMPGYFNVELQNQSKRIVIDFAQMAAAQIDAQKMKEKLKKSPYVKDVKMMADPSDGTLSVILDLKKPAKLKVYQVPGKKAAAKVVVDLLT